MPGFDPPSGFPRIFVYAVCWNEEKLLPYFFRHYSSFASRITIYDNQSTDRSREIIQSHPGAVLRTIDSQNEFREVLLTETRNQCWKEARELGVDYVIIVDIDEIVVFPDLERDFAAFKQLGITVLRPTGYDMVSEDFPETQGQIYTEVRNGVFNHYYCKPCVFDPRKIDEINLTLGSHDCRPQGEVCMLLSHGIRLFHFNAVGRSYFLQRKRVLKSRYGAINEGKLGVQYLFSEEQHIERFDELLRTARPVV